MYCSAKKYSMAISTKAKPSLDSGQAGGGRIARRLRSGIEDYCSICGRTLRPAVAGLPIENAVLGRPRHWE
jgi:hypothetical protein